jgi:hypothetical protein
MVTAMHMPTFALAIPHTPWVPERAASFARLRGQLREREPAGLKHRVFDEKEPNHEWSRKLWEWGERAQATHLLQLQDDVVVAPNFWPALQAMVTARPNDVIVLESAHPAAMTLARAGRRWYSSSDAVIGVGYLIPYVELAHFLFWLGSALKPGAREALTEDTLIAIWCVATGRRIYCPVPTVIDHDTTIASTYGNDQHSYRRPSVTWRDGDVCGWADADLERPDFWSPASTEHLGRFYPSVHHLAALWTTTFTATDIKRLDADVCPPQHARFFR